MGKGIVFPDGVGILPFTVSHTPFWPEVVSASSRFSPSSSSVLVAYSKYLLYENEGPRGGVKAGEKSAAVSFRGLERARARSSSSPTPSPELRAVLDYPFRLE